MSKIERRYKIKKIAISVIVLIIIISINTNCFAKYVIDEHIEKAIKLEIDRTSPILEIEYSDTKNLNLEIEVMIKSNEIIQEVDGWQLLQDQKTLIKTYSNNVDEIIYIKDLSGNTSEANIKINNVEDEKIAIISN